jgi:arylsulfatase A-like enzyme
MRPRTAVATGCRRTRSGDPPKGSWGFAPQGYRQPYKRLVGAPVLGDRAGISPVGVVWSGIRVRVTKSCWASCGRPSKGVVVNWRWGIFPAILAASACTNKAKPVDFTRAKAELREASAGGRNAAWVEGQTGKPLRINDVIQKVLPAWAPSRLSFHVAIPKSPRLRFSYAVLAEGDAPGGVEFSVRVGADTVWRGHVDPVGHPAHQRWLPGDVDLAPYSGRTVDLIFETRVAERATNPPRAFWGDPALTSPVPDAPLVIVYLVDTLRADHTGPYGYARDTTPNLNAFAKDAVVFETAISQASWTKPSVASLMTSKLPAQHRAVQLRDALDPSLKTIAERFSERGYATGAAIANSVIYSEGTNFDQGFDFFAGLHGPHNRPSKLVLASGVVDAALSFVDLRLGFPSFLYVHTMDPHVPYSPHPPFDRRYEPYATAEHPATDPRTDFKEPLDRDRMIARYDGNIAYGDEEFGRFVRELKKRGLYEKALIVFMADHGEEFQDHGQWLHGRSVFDELIHIPLIIKFPGEKDAGRRVKPQVQEVDILPTLLASQGMPIPKPPEILGHPLQDVLEGDPHEILAIAEISHRGYVARGIRSSADKYIERFSPEEGELYFDLLKDPRELANRLEERPGRVRELRAALDQVMSANPFQNHLRTRGAGEFDLRLRTSGWFEGVDGSGLGTDTFASEANGRRLHLKIDSKLDKPREIAFSVRPSGAPVFLDGTRDGRPIRTTDIFCGEEGISPSSIPAELPEVEGKESETHPENNLLAPPAKERPGVELWLTSTSGVKMPVANCESLVALGYLPADACSKGTAR